MVYRANQNIRCGNDEIFSAKNVNGIKINGKFYNLVHLADGIAPITQNENDLRASMNNTNDLQWELSNMKIDIAKTYIIRYTGDKINMLTSVLMVKIAQVKHFKYIGSLNCIATETILYCHKIYLKLKKNKVHKI